MLARRIQRSKWFSKEEIKHFPTKNLKDRSEYDEYFPILKNRHGRNIRAKALEKAWHLRDFEINLYWERAKYFWGFIASSFAAYFISLGSISEHFPELPFIVISIGIIFSLAWLIVNLGSKKWQENWEAHIDYLEDNFIGPLYRTVLNVKNFSVSKVNIVTSAFMLVIWLLLGISFLSKNCRNLDPLIITATLIVTFIFIWVLFVFTVTGRSKNKFHFRIRELK